MRSEGNRVPNPNLKLTAPSTTETPPEMSRKRVRSCKSSPGIWNCMTA